MRGRALGPHRIGILDLHQVAVADPGVKAHPLAAESALQIGDELLGLRLRNVPGREILHAAIDARYQVAAEDELIRRQGDPLGDGFQRRPSRVVLLGAVAHHAQGRDIAAGGVPPGYGPDASHPTGGHDRMHVRDPGRLQRRLPIQFRDRFIGATIRQNQCVLHDAYSSCSSTTRIVTGVARTTSRSAISFSTFRICPSGAK